MRFLLKVHGGNDAIFAQAAVVLISREERELLLRRRAMFLAIKGYDPGLLYLEYWAYVDWLEALSSADTVELLDKGELLLDPADYDGTALRVECETCIIDERGVHWSCLVKHTDVRLETVEIPWALLELR